MKNILKKNQVIIAALAIMIVIAGYLNFTRDQVKNSDANPVSAEDKNAKDADAAIPNEALDITDQASAKVGDAGDAVLATNSLSAEFFTASKLKREQTRASNEETLKGIINNTNVSDKQKQAAIDDMIKLTAVKEKETVTESLLEAKGFGESLVTITDKSVEVIINSKNLTEQQMAQIEDIVKRKTGMSAENIVISPVSVSKDGKKATKSSTDTKKSKESKNEVKKETTAPADSKTKDSKDTTSSKTGQEDSSQKDSSQKDADKAK